MDAFEYRQAQEIRNGFQRHGIRYVLIGKSATLPLAARTPLEGGIERMSDVKRNAPGLAARSARLAILSPGLLCENIKPCPRRWQGEL